MVEPTHHDRPTMKTNLTELHATLDAIAANDDEGLTKRRLAELPELPATEWTALQQQLHANTLEVREMAVFPADFGIFAAPPEQLRFNLLKYTAMAMPIAAIALTLFYSAWCLLLIPLALLPLQVAKRLYRRVLAESAAASEQIFAFLFSRNMIYLFQDGKSYYRDNREQSST
jgi:hypothetical protein